MMNLSWHRWIGLGLGGVVCLAGAAGILLGEALIRPGQRPRAEAFRHAVGQAGKLLAVAIPFLVGAGLIEGYISPDPAYPLPFKLALGLAYGALFWWVLAGRGAKLRTIGRSPRLGAEV